MVIQHHVEHVIVHKIIEILNYVGEIDKNIYYVLVMSIMQNMLMPGSTSYRTQMPQTQFNVGAPHPQGYSFMKDWQQAANICMAAMAM